MFYNYFKKATIALLVIIYIFLYRRTWAYEYYFSAVYLNFSIALLLLLILTAFMLSKTKAFVISIGVYIGIVDIILVLLRIFETDIRWFWVRVALLIFSSYQPFTPIVGLIADVFKIRGQNPTIIILYILFSIAIYGMMLAAHFAGRKYIKRSAKV